MSLSRRAKRPRIGGTSYHDAVPLTNNETNYNAVQFSEGRLWRTGAGIMTAPMEKSSHPVAGTWQNTAVWTTPDDPNFTLDPNGEMYDEVVQQNVMVEKPVALPKKKHKKSRLAKRPHVIWKENYRQAYLDELVRLAGRGDFRTSQGCPGCKSTESHPEYRCRECYLPELLCASCCVKRHRHQPFHRVEKWTGSSFIKTSLKTLGLKIQLNHASMFCENPIPCHQSLLVLHTNGIHSVSIQYCGCSNAIPIHLQLLRRRLYPATQLSVRTCASFELLDLLHKLALTTKASTYDFYRCLEKLTDGSGTMKLKTRYHALLRMVLQWRHLKMLKWGGRGHDPTGVVGTLPGQLAVVCPLCPHPGVNVPDDWGNAAEDMKFLYTVFICMDANFRLKNQLVSNYSQDPGLGIGWAYMVARSSYEEYVLSRAKDEDISTCVGFQALAKANTKFSVGLRYTGVGATVCGRSEMLFPLGVGNLQKGERYANMDFIFGSALRFVAALLVIVSYDICCQWFVNLWKRIEAHWPDEIKPRENIKLTPAIPKLHEKMHERANHEVFSLNFIPGAGYTDCECPERVWSPHNALGNSTKTQGPGSRQDVLDDHFGFWNWEKYINQGHSLARRYKAAVADRNRQMEGFCGLGETIPGNIVAKWEQMCIEWERDNFPKTKENPYYMEGICISEAQAKKELANEESQFLKGGGTFPHATTASMFILLGLDLEETQRRLRRTAKAGSTTPTDRQEGSLTEQRNSLLMRIRGWESLSPIYMPGLLQYLTDNPPTPPPTSNPEDTRLMLPSQIPEPHRSRICTTGLPEIEEKLRTAQCSDALDSIRRILTLKSWMVQFKNQNIRGQREGTRSRAVIDRVHERARLSAEKYRKAREAKLALSGPGEWEVKLKVLEDGDIRGFQDANQLRPRQGRKGIWEDDELEEIEASQEEQASQQTSEFVLFNEPRSRQDGTGEMRRTLSWIWTSSSAPSSKDNYDALRVEWAKARARTKRATEEVMLLKEEMRRVLAFLDWKARWWMDRFDCRMGISTGLAEGINAYAASQAALQLALAQHFRVFWRAPLDDPVIAASESDTLDKDGQDGEDGEEDSEDEEDEEENAIFDPNDVV